MFLSYHSGDRPLVERIAVRLKAAGVEPWLDAWCLTPGGEWQQELAAGLEASETCAVFVGARDLGGWERLEVGLALDRAARAPAYRVFPVLLPQPGPFDPNAMPSFLRTRTWVDFRAGPEDDRALQDLVHAIEGTPFGPGAPLEPTGACPYLGLQTFEEADADLFFGREGQVQRLLEQLRSSRFLAVVGSSGSGKSSLVRAGLVPALRAGRLPGSDRWTVRVLRPGGRPLTALAAQLVQLDGRSPLHDTILEIGRQRGALHACVAAVLAERPQDRVVLVVDQLEEVFTLTRNAPERASFLDALVDATTVPHGQTVVIVTLRADFYRRLVEHPEFAQLAQAHQLLVAPLDRDGLRQAVEQPARQVGLGVEAGLTEMILEDTAAQPGGMPLLEHALLETWMRRRDGRLTITGYQAAGRVQGALCARAEAVFSELTRSEQDAAREVLLRLTEPGDGTEDTRRRAPYEDLMSSPTRRALVETVVSRLADARLLTVGTNDGDGRWVDVSHEALIRGWPRLQGWVDEDRTGLRIQRRLADVAHDWERRGRDRSVLYRGRLLRETREWRRSRRPALNDTERAFLSASGRLRVVVRTLLGVAAALLLVGSILVMAPRVREYLWSRQAAGPVAAFPAGWALLGGGGPGSYRTVVRVSLPAFALERHEVSNRQYRLCVRAERCLPPADLVDSRLTFDEFDPGLPVVNVTARQAAGYCRWVRRRLPTEAEWERAARGTHGARWPWGEERPTRARANSQFGSTPPRAPTHVDDSRLRAGASRDQRVMQLVGNVREWTSTPAGCRQYRCTREWDGRGRVTALIVRGGGWEEPPLGVSGKDATPFAAFSYGESTGFRCASSE